MNDTAHPPNMCSENAIRELLSFAIFQIQQIDLFSHFIKFKIFLLQIRVNCHFIKKLSCLINQFATKGIFKSQRKNRNKRRNLISTAALFLNIFILGILVESQEERRVASGEVTVSEALLLKGTSKL